MPTWLWIVIIIVVVLAAFGYFVEAAPDSRGGRLAAFRSVAARS